MEECLCFEGDSVGRVKEQDKRVMFCRKTKYDSFVFLPRFDIFRTEDSLY